MQQKKTFKELVEENKNKSSNTGSKIFITVIAIFIILLIIGTCSKSSIKNEEKSIDKTSNLDNSPTVTEDTIPKNWFYKSTTNKMTDVITNTATTTSTNLVDFDYPYNGGVRFSFCLRKNTKTKEIDIMLIGDNCQFMPNLNDEKTVKIRFDNKDLYEVGYSESSSGSSNVIFLNNVYKIIAKLKASKKIMIEAEFYNDGKKIIEFDVFNLKWD